MPSYRLPWLGGWESTVAQPRQFATSACATRMMGASEILRLPAAWVLITKDEDLVEGSLDSHEGPLIVWLRIGNCTNRVLFTWLEPLLPEILKQLESGQRIVEVRKARMSG